ncbi:MAG: hypothetical protein Q8N14_04795 [Candidatus Omnitrophota bacterium]|nr:hypothetical protein [Candidatus Omnitrophota bacterium]
MLKKFYKLFFLMIFGIMLTDTSFSLAKEASLPTFRITGYIEKINADSIRIFVPRMKQSLALILKENIQVTDFTSQKKYSLSDLREKDMAVCEGVISAEGFVCQSIAFVRQEE